MKTIYKTIKSITESNDMQTVSYGITALDTNGVPFRTVCDLFESAADADSFAKLCTELELSPEQLDDVIQDILAIK